jgi:hypothetical protein
MRCETGAVSSVQGMIGYGFIRYILDQRSDLKFAHEQYFAMYSEVQAGHKMTVFRRSDLVWGTSNFDLKYIKQAF